MTANIIFIKLDCRLTYRASIGYNSVAEDQGTT